jgi:hypothetical protein
MMMILTPLQYFLQTDDAMQRALLSCSNLGSSRNVSQMVCHHNKPLPNPGVMAFTGMQWRLMNCWTNLTIYHRWKCLDSFVTPEGSKAVPQPYTKAI